jgi:hypothetical protein
VLGGWTFRASLLGRGGAGRLTRISGGFPPTKATHVRLRVCDLIAPLLLRRFFAVNMLLIVHASKRKTAGCNS